MEYQVSLRRDSFLAYPEGLQPTGRTHTEVEEKYEEGATVKTLDYLQPLIAHALCATWLWEEEVKE